MAKPFLADYVLRDNIQALRQSVTRSNPLPSAGKFYEKGKDGKDFKESKDGKDGKDSKDSKDTKDGKDSKDGKDFKDSKDYKDSKDFKDSKDTKDFKDGKDTKDGKDRSDWAGAVTPLPSPAAPGGMIPVGHESGRDEVRAALRATRANRMLRRTGRVI